MFHVEQIFKKFSVLLLLALTGCTVVRYQDTEGRRLLAVDLRLSGSAVGIKITRPDGTTVIVDRQQDSPEATVTAVGDIAADLFRPGILP